MEMQNFAPIMFAGLVVVMLVGFPVAFSLAALGLGSGLYAIQMGWFPQAFMSNLPISIFNGIISNDLLLAIPFFTFMGTILEKCGLAEDMLDSMGQLFGPVRGGLGYSVIIVGFILGAITGTVAGQVIAMALISLPVMIRPCCKSPCLPPTPLRWAWSSRITCPACPARRAPSTAGPSGKNACKASSLRPC
jgi:TRAP-type mannitol/chloroaromatic compound transport system permease large subunit